MTKTGRPSARYELSAASIFGLPPAIVPTFLHSPRLSSTRPMTQRSPPGGRSWPERRCQLSALSQQPTYGSVSSWRSPVQSGRAGPRLSCVPVRDQEATERAELRLCDSAVETWSLRVHPGDVDIHSSLVEMALMVPSDFSERLASLHGRRRRPCGAMPLAIWGRCQADATNRVDQVEHHGLPLGQPGLVHENGLELVGDLGLRATIPDKRSCPCGWSVPAPCPRKRRCC